MPETATAARGALKTKFISHGTIEAADLSFSKKFFGAFLGFEAISTR